MTSQENPSKVKAALYARVSTAEQAVVGYSLSQQMERLRSYCEQMGYEVCEEVEDAGFSGSSLERPGMDRVRDLVASGAVNLVLAQDRDRLSREPAELYILTTEFRDKGATLRAMNDLGDDSPEGELTKTIFDAIAKFERIQTAERSRRGKRQKVLEGKILGTGNPAYGFAYNEERNGYIVDEGRMQIVREIFERISIGHNLNSIKRWLEDRGIPAPRSRWNVSTIRNIVNNDVYLPHSKDDLLHYVKPSVVSSISGEPFGVWFYGKQRHSSKQVSTVDPSNGKKRYGKRTTRTDLPKSQWVGVPVPDAGILYSTVMKARDNLTSHSNPATTPVHEYELTGVIRCGECGRSMGGSSIRNNGKVYSYYRCTSARDKARGECFHTRMVPASEVEPLVWGDLRKAMSNPQKIRSRIDAAIEARRSSVRDPSGEADAWLKKIHSLETKKGRFQDMAAESLISLKDLREKMSTLEIEMNEAEENLERVRNLEQSIAAMQRERESMVSYCETISEQMLDDLPSKQKNALYQKIGVVIRAYPDGNFTAQWRYNASEETLCQNESRCASPSRLANSPVATINHYIFLMKLLEDEVEVEVV